MSWQICPVPVPYGIDDIEKHSHENSCHRGQDEVAKCFLVGQDDHEEELDGLHDGVEGVLHPADRAPELLLDAFL